MHSSWSCRSLSSSPFWKVGSLPVRMEGASNGFFWYLDRQSPRFQGFPDRFEHRHSSKAHSDPDFGPFLNMRLCRLAVRRPYNHPSQHGIGSNGRATAERAPLDAGRICPCDEKLEKEAQRCSRSQLGSFYSWA